MTTVTFHCSGESTREIIDVLRIAERSVNNAIREGADEVKLSYHNILDPVKNPEGKVGTIHIVGYRTGGASTYETEKGPEALRCQRDAWEETAAQSQRNTDYYRGLVIEIGELFGEAARTADDGGVHEDVLCAKVPGLVKMKDTVHAIQVASLVAHHDYLQAKLDYIEATKP